MFGISTFSQPLPEGPPPESIKLVPLGKFAANDGRRFEIADAEAVVAATRKHAGGRDLPIDYEHQVDRAAANGQPAPAAGWIKDVEIREDGIYGRVDWTEKGATLIASREYRYISPVLALAKGKAQKVVAILRAALVNTPALDMPALAKSFLREEEAMTLDELMTKLKAALKMADDATEEDMLAALDKLAAADTDPDPEPATMSTIRKELCKGLGLDADTPISQVVAAVTELSQSIAAPEGTVSVAEFKAMADEVTSLRAERADETAEAAVDAAITAGKITPAQKDSMVTFCKSDADGFAAFVEAAPTIIREGEQFAHQKLTGTGDDALTATEVATCKSMGLTPEEFIASRKDIEARAGGIH